MLWLEWIFYEVSGGADVRERPRLARLFTAGIEGWLQEQADIDRLMKLFRPDENAHSVYRVLDGEEEWLVAAAHTLTTKQHAGPLTVLRIDEATVTDFGLTIDSTIPGTTGIVWADGRHKDVCGSREQLRELVTFLARQCSRGHDLVRRIEKPYVERALRRFCREDECRCPPHAKVIARWAIKETASRDLDVERIRTELLGLDFEDHLGSQFDQSLVAVFRETYVERYLREVAKRINKPFPSQSDQEADKGRHTDSGPGESLKPT